MSAPAPILKTCPWCEPGVTLPGSGEMDRAVLSCMMQAPATAVDAALQLLTAADFYTPAAGTLFDVICRRYAAGEPVDAMALTAYLYDRGMIEGLGGPLFVTECYTAATLTNHVRHYAEAVATASKRRQMARLASELACAAIHGSQDSDDWRDAAMPLMRRADALLVDGTASEVIPLKEVATRYLDYVDSNPGGIDPPVRTGINRLDSLLTGGIRREYTLIGGRQGHGKTLLAMQLAGKLAAAGRRGYVVGYEMSALQILMRDIARETRVPVTHVMGREPFEGMEVQQVTRGISRMVEGWDVWYTDSPYVTLEGVAAHARSLHRQKPLDFIVIDYLQLVPMKRARGNQERSDEILKDISVQAERLRKELGCTLIAPVQLNDDGLIRDARGILDAPQAFIRIEMEEAAGEDGAIQSGDNGFLRVLKNRFGITNRACPVFRNGNYQCFEDREPPAKDITPRTTRTRRWQG